MAEKWYVALVNYTDREIFFSEEWPTYDEAYFRASVNLASQALMNASGGSLNPEDKGKDWQAVGPLEKPFEFEPLEKSE